MGRFLPRAIDACLVCQECRGELYLLHRDQAQDLLRLTILDEQRRQPRPDWGALERARKLLNDCTEACLRDRPRIAEGYGRTG